MSGSLPPSTKSLWLDRAQAAERAPLRGRSEVDVAIVGGGIIGVTSALLLAQRGVSVAVVEARTISGGVTGNSTAKATALQSTQYSTIARKIGAGAAEAYAQANKEGVALIADLAQRHDIDCSLERTSNFLYAEDESGIAKVENEHAAARDAGLAVQLTTETELPFEVLMATRLDNQVAFDSAAFTLGLASAAEAAGAAIHEHSRVRSVSHDRPCRLELANGGTLLAGKVLLATHMPLLDRGLFFARLRPEASHAISALVDTAAPLGMYLGVGSSTRSIRSAPGSTGRRHLIVAGEGNKVGHRDGAEGYATLAEWTAQRFGAHPIQHRWSAHDLMSPDGLPMIGALAPWAPRISTATGFSKWGLAMGVSAAAMLCAEIVDEPDPKREPFDPSRLPLRAQLVPLAKENVDVGLSFFGGRLRRKSPSTELRAGEGRVVREGLRQVAECRDSEGTLHRVAARCTHLGCIVKWNSGDQIWDCPCHGSRFAPDGSVIAGPASAPLEPERSVMPSGSSDA